eukprot:309851-Chlamydomonas_euryale.AAC.1
MPPQAWPAHSLTGAPYPVSAPNSSDPLSIDHHLPHTHRSASNVVLPRPHRCTMPCVWQYSRASTVSAMYCRATSSSRPPNLRSRLKQSPPF